MNHSMASSLYQAAQVFVVLCAYIGVTRAGNCVVTVPNPITTDVSDSGWTAAGTLKNCIDQGDSSGGYVYITFDLPFVGDVHQVVLPTIRM